MVKVDGSSTVFPITKVMVEDCEKEKRDGTKKTVKSHYVLEFPRGVRLSNHATTRDIAYQKDQTGQHQNIGGGLGD
jgi:ABC-type phosphate transport system substrate-binding protein